MFEEALPTADPEAPEELPENMYLYRATISDLGHAFVTDVKGPDALAKVCVQVLSL